ncbi:type III pantothenate kinase [Ferrigenium kumadai]|uniref:Type III pantothenate kinase n=1 Tax=Ferrigenium kumadai TaxID=1682490 RepID=A0AAN1T126_9PROT|nr:type III pantothenate kinase [Ferrigenium kumadai]BBJ00292.1 type III pantothenate kinase [Ferrigenium kumadai]
MRLLLDAGNTRIKWALVSGDEWLRRGDSPTERAEELSQQLADVGEVRQIWVSNVAGETVARHIRELRVGQHGEPHFIVARTMQCGVRNGYDDPAQLGSDRWAALIAAWHLAGRGCLVVNSGTATTVDALSATGEFLGGLILPGMVLMQRSLSASTARIRLAQGSYAAFPKNTADALFSGAIQASCGAIGRQHALLDDAGAPVVLGGGAAEILREHLNLPLLVVDNLVLQGILLIAQEASE